MKNLIKSGLAILIICISVATVSGQQKIKLGHVDSNELLKLMPEKDSAQAVLENYGKMLQKTLSEMETEFQNKYNDYMANSKTYTDLIKANKEKELTDLDSRIQSFKTQAQEDLQKKESDLLTPIIDKAKNAIEAVAKENGYTYIFDTAVGVLLYYGESDDILPLVKKKLNLK